MLSTIATSESRAGSTSIAPSCKEAVWVTSPRKSRSSSLKARLMAGSAEPSAFGLLSITYPPPGHKPARPSLCTAKWSASSRFSTRLSQGPDQGLAGTGLLLLGNLDWRKWLRYWSNTHSSDQIGEGTFDELYQVRKIRALLFHGLCRLGKIDWASESHQELTRCLSRTITASKNFND